MWWRRAHTVHTAGVDLDGRPAYERLAELLRAGITSGRYPAGSALPSIQALKSQHGVSTTTVRRAVAELVLQGLVVSQQGSGSYVKQGAPEPTLPERVAALEAGQREILERLERIDGSPRD